MDRSYPVRARPQRHAADQGVHRRRRRGHARPGGRGPAGGQGHRPGNGGAGAGRPRGLGAGERGRDRLVRRRSGRRGRAPHGIRIPKVESAAEVRWVTERAPGRPIICAIESARGVLAAQEIASVPGVKHLAMGGVDLQRDLNTSGGNLQTLYVRSHLVLASRAAGLEPPIDSVYPRLDDPAGLREQADSLARLFRQVRHPSRAAAHPARDLHSLRRRHHLGTKPFSMLSTPPTAEPCGCRPASSSTCRSPTGPAGCCRSPGPPAAEPHYSRGPRSPTASSEFTRPPGVRGPRPSRPTPADRLPPTPTGRTVPPVDAKPKLPPLLDNWAWAVPERPAAAWTRPSSSHPGRIDHGIPGHPGQAGQRRCCERCPVVAECLTHALQTREPYSMWGGRSESEHADLLGLDSLRYQARRDRPRRWWADEPPRGVAGVGGPPMRHRDGVDRTHSDRRSAPRTRAVTGRKGIYPCLR